MLKNEIPEYFIIPESEINQISLGLTKFNTVLLIGSPGVGKTALAKYYEMTNPLKFKEVIYYSAFEFDFNNLDISFFNTSPHQKKDRLIIIDGLNDVFLSDTKSNIIRLVLEGRKYGIKTLITTRESVIDSHLINNSYPITLKGWDSNQVMSFLKAHFKRGALSAEFSKQFRALSEKLENNPLLIIFAINSLKNENITPRELLELLNKKLLYKNSIIESFEKNKILVPEKPQIITDISLINTNLLEKVKNNPKIIYNMTSRQFEELVAELFYKEGYKVTLTKETRDGGKDLLIVEQKRIGNFIIYVECKNYSFDNPIGVRLVRELYGSIMADRATAGVLVTSSYFSKPAVQFTENVKSQLSLIDYVKLYKWIDESVLRNKT